MSKNLNRCEFIGRMGQDPEQRFTSGGQSVVSFSLAVGDDYKDKQGQKVEQTEWVNFTAFGKGGELIHQYCNKGSKLWVSGKFKTDKWQNKEGVTMYTTKIHVQDFEFLGGNEQAQKPQNNGSVVPNQSSPATGFDDFLGGIDSEIPFNQAP